MNKLVNQCRICRYFKTTTLVQRIIPLPEERVTPSPQLKHVGIDFLAPLYIKNEFQEAEKSVYVMCNTWSTSGAHTQHDNRKFSISFDKEDVEKRQD